MKRLLMLVLACGLTSACGALSSPSGQQPVTISSGQVTSATPTASTSGVGPGEEAPIEFDLGPFDEPPEAFYPAEWRVSLDEAISGAAFSVKVPQHPAASPTNLEGVWEDPEGSFVVMQFPPPASPQQPLRRPWLEVYEEPWNQDDVPESYWNGLLEDANPQRDVSLYTIDGVVAIGSAAHPPDDPYFHAVLRFAIDNVEIRMTGGEDLNLLIEIARTIIEQEAS